MKKYHVTKSDGIWKLKAVDAEKASRTAATKDEITKLTREYMKKHEGSVVFHKETGEFQEERTYPKSKDPHKTKG